MSDKDHEVAVTNIVDSLGLLRKVESFYGIIKYRMIDGQLVEPNIAMKSYGIFIPVCIVFVWTIIILDTWFDIQVNIFFNSHLDSTDYIDRLPMVVTVVQSSFALVVFLCNDFKFHLETLFLYLYVKMISKRIEVLNKYLNHFVEKKAKIRPIVIFKENLEVNKLGDYIGHINHENTKITSLAFAYETLGESLSLLNNMCSINIFLYLASNFIYIIISLWSFVHFIRTKDHLSSLPGIIFESSVEISVVIIMCYVCEELTMKRRSTRILVNEIVMDYKLPNEMRIQAKSFFDLIEVWPLQVYASRMFCMNIQLLLGFVSVSSTYLIFIIQATN
ncbi:uncharacterized protein LOC116769675 [Danaus plexippus]|uniref:uncharacterized protein LOC116769675 n=1 Tax=Danaus plexippus TaxID=13037 RepID=UPI002AAF60AF|nr:uncharacterized protein LOC116769675 [Danaus plexippus]